MKFSKLTLFSLLSLSAASRVLACDLCGCYTPRLEVVHERPVGIYAGVAEQFTHFSTDRINGREVDNPTGQHLDSSITQFVLGATFFQNRLAVQVNVPFLYRSYKRPAGFEIERGRVSGLGDISLLANFLVFKKIALFRGDAEPDFSASLHVTAGLKFPTGDARRIKEEFAEIEIEGAPESGIHGHDLTLGTGSYDGIFGAQAEARYRSVFFEAEVQYALRGSGHYHYCFADDLQWSGGPGVYLVRHGADSFALQFVISGETKGYDRFQGEPARDTGVTSLYVGPRVLGSLGRFTGELGVEVPVLMHTTSFQTTADFRIRAGFAVHF